MRAAEVDEAIHIPLSIVRLDAAGGVERHLKLRLRQVAFQIYNVVETWIELNFSKAEPIVAVIVEILDLVRGRVENHRLTPHVGRLMGPGKEVTELAGVGARAKTLPVGVEVS